MPPTRDQLVRYTYCPPTTFKLPLAVGPMNVLTPRLRISAKRGKESNSSCIPLPAQTPASPGTRQGNQASKNTNNSVTRRPAAQPRPKDADEAAPSPPQQRATWHELQALKLDVEMHVSKITLSPKSDKHLSRRPNTAPNSAPESMGARPAQDQREERNGASFHAPCVPDLNPRRWKKRSDGSW